MQRKSKKFPRTGDLRHIYQNKLDMDYRDFKDQRGLMVYKFFDTKTSCSGIKNISNKELAEELHKPTISKFN